MYSLKVPWSQKLPGKNSVTSLPGSILLPFQGNKNWELGTRGLGSLTAFWDRDFESGFLSKSTGTQKLLLVVQFSDPLHKIKKVFFHEEIAGKTPWVTSLKFQNVSE